MNDACCDTHRGYQAKRKPLIACPGCWTAWARCHPKSPSGRIVRAMEDRGAILRSRQAAAIIMELERRRKP